MKFSWTLKQSIWPEMDTQPPQQINREVTFEWQFCLVWHRISPLKNFGHIYQMRTYNIVIWRKLKHTHLTWPHSQWFKLKPYQNRFEFQKIFKALKYLREERNKFLQKKRTAVYGRSLQEIFQIKNEKKILMMMSLVKWCWMGSHKIGLQKEWGKKWKSRANLRQKIVQLLFDQTIFSPEKVKIFFHSPQMKLRDFLENFRNAETMWVLWRTHQYSQISEPLVQPRLPNWHLSGQWISWRWWDNVCAQMEDSMGEIYSMYPRGASWFRRLSRQIKSIGASYFLIISRNSQFL